MAGSVGTRAEKNIPEFGGAGKNIFGFFRLGWARFANPNIERWIRAGLVRIRAGRWLSRLSAATSDAQYWFPYKLMYAVESDHIYVIAVAHQHRKPDYWTTRSDA